MKVPRLKQCAEFRRNRFWAHYCSYINNICNVGITGHILLYADDTCLFYFGHSIDSVINEAQQDLNILNIWLKPILLTINVKKTAYIIFCAKNKKIPNFPPLTVDGQHLQRSNQEKYLGLILDSRLTFRPHIEHVRSRLIPLIGALRNIAKCVPFKLRYTIYNTLVKPHLEYLIQIWGQAAATNLQDLQITQNKVIKILFNYDYLAPTKEIYMYYLVQFSCKFIYKNLQKLYTYHTCILIYKILSNKIHSQTTFKHKIKHYPTRNRDIIELPSVRTLYGRKTIQFEGAQLYNKLPKCIQNSTSINVFKNKQKLHLLNQ